MLTSEITSLQLDWIVTDLEGVKTYGIKDWLEQRRYTTGQRWSIDWAQGGPIIEREMISVWPWDDVTWKAEAARDAIVFEGKTPLIAAMRCFCCDKLGDIVDVPEEICQQQSS